MTFNGLLKGKGFTRFIIDLDNSSPVKKSMVIDTPNKTIKIKQKIPNIFIIIMHSPHTMILIYYLYRECYYPFFCIMFQQYTNNELIKNEPRYFSFVKSISPMVVMLTSSTFFNSACFSSKACINVTGVAALP